jgi:hypothetical protein
MKKSKFTEQQIAFALRQAETGTKVKEIIRQMGDHRTDVLPLEAKVRRPGSVGAAKATAARGRDTKTEEARGGPLA